MKKWFGIFVAILLVTIASRSAFAGLDEKTANLQKFNSWVTHRMATWVPPGRTEIVEAQETPSDGLDGYGKIAQTVTEIAFDPSEIPLFDGKNGRSKTVAVIMAIASRESSFRKDVEFGVGKQAVGDHGRSWCGLQIQLGRVGPDGKTPLRIHLTDSGFQITYGSNSGGWGGEDLVSATNPAEARARCYRAGLHLIRHSFNVCKNRPVAEKLSAYASGNCSLGKAASRARINRAINWFNSDPAPISDEDMFRALSVSIVSIPKHSSLFFLSPLLEGLFGRG